MKLMKESRVPVRIEGRINNVNKKGRSLRLDSSKIKVLEENCTWQQLSQRRADNVALYLHDHGIDPQYAIPSSIATYEPISMNPASVEINRRVNFVLVDNK